MNRSLKVYIITFFFFIITATIIYFTFNYYINKESHSLLLKLEKKVDQRFLDIFNKFDNIKYDTLRYNTTNMPIQEYMEDTLDATNAFLTNYDETLKIITKYND